MAGEWVGESRREEHSSSRLVYHWEIVEAWIFCFKSWVQKLPLLSLKSNLASIQSQAHCLPNDLNRFRRPCLLTLPSAGE